MRGILGGVVSVFIAAAPSAALAIDYVSQFRSVDATAGIGGGGAITNHDESTALGPWTAAESANFGDLNGGASGDATQISDLTNQQISMSGALSATSSPGYLGAGRSELSIVFSLDSASVYNSSLSTTGATDTSFSGAGFPFGFDANGSGTLPPGDYSLSLIFDVVVGGGSVSGTYLYSLSIVPEPSCACLLLIGMVLLTARQGRV